MQLRTQEERTAARATIFGIIEQENTTGGTSEWTLDNRAGSVQTLPVTRTGRELPQPSISPISPPEVAVPFVSASPEAVTPSVAPSVSASPEEHLVAASPLQSLELPSVLSLPKAREILPSIAMAQTATRSSYSLLDPGVSLEGSQQEGSQLYPNPRLDIA